MMQIERKKEIAEEIKKSKKKTNEKLTKERKKKNKQLKTRNPFA